MFEVINESGSNTNTSASAVNISPTGAPATVIQSHYWDREREREILREGETKVTKTSLGDAMPWNNGEVPPSESPEALPD